MSTGTETYFDTFTAGWHRGLEALKENESREDYVDWRTLRESDQPNLTIAAQQGYRSVITEALDLTWHWRCSDIEKTATRLEAIGPQPCEDVLIYGPRRGDANHDERQAWLLEGFEEGIEAVREGWEDVNEDAHEAYRQARIHSRKDATQRCVDRARGRRKGVAEASFLRDAIHDREQLEKALDAMIETARKEGEIPAAGRFLPEPPPRLPKTLEEFAEQSRQGMGFVSEVITLNLDSAPKPQPIFALGGALALTAAILGRRVKDEFDGRTNLQIIAVGETSSGKDFARWLADEILGLSDNQQIIAPGEVTSDSALYRTLEEYPSRLFQIDEFGRFLQTATVQANSNLYAVISALMKLYSSADRSTFIPKSYASKKHCPDIEIAWPHLVLHATTTPEAVYSGLGASSVDDGFLGRCLIFESTEQPRKQTRPRKEIPASVLDFGRYWASKQDIVGDLLGPPAVIVPTTEEANKAFEAFEDTCHEKLTSKTKGSKLWGRAEQKARQVALVVACSKCPSDPVIDEHTARWACHLVELQTKHMQGLAVRWLASNQIEADAQRLLRLIEESEPAGMTKSELTRKSQWLRSQVRNEYLKTLIDSNLVEVDQEQRLHAVANED